MERPGAIDRRGTYPLGVTAVGGALGCLAKDWWDDREKTEAGDEVSGAHRILRYGRAKRTTPLPGWISPITHVVTPVLVAAACAAFTASGGSTATSPTPRLNTSRIS